MSKSDAERALSKLGAKWSSNFDDYASGKISAHELVCVKCDKAPCACTVCPVRGCGFSVEPGGACPRGHS